MSFFHLTSLGYENRFQSMQRLEPVGPPPVQQILSPRQSRTSTEKELVRELTGNVQSREWSTPAVSNLNYHSLRHMHVRGDQDSHQVVRGPLTTAQEIGWWKKDEPLKINEPWTREKHYVHAQSEMTKFVDTMMLSDRYFQLY